MASPVSAASSSADTADSGCSILRIRVTEIVDPFNFYALLATEPVLEAFDEFEKALNEECAKHSERADISELSIGQELLVYCGKLAKWVRATVVSIDLDDGEVDVMHSDYRTTEYITSKDIIPRVPMNFSCSSLLTWRCMLVDIKPIARTWISRAINRFSDLVLMKTHDASIHTDSSSMASSALGLEIILDDEGSVQSVSDILMEEGLAIPCPPVTQPPQADTSPADGPQSTESNGIPQFNMSLLQKKPGQSRTKKSAGISIEEELHRSRLGLGEGSQPFEASDLMIVKGQFGRLGDVKGSIQRQMEEFKRIKHQAALEEANGERDGSPRRNRSPASLPYRHLTPPTPGRGAGSRQSSTNSSTHSRHSSSSPRPHSHSPVPHRFRDANGSREADTSGMSGVNQSKPPRREARGRGDGDRHHGGSRYGPVTAGGAALRDKLLNEYDWHSHQYLRSVKQLLDQLDTETGKNMDKILEELLYLVYPDKSILKDLPGPSELPLTMEKVLIMAITDFKKWSDNFTHILAIFNTDSSFGDMMSELLWNLQNRYVKCSKLAKGKEQCQNYCRMLAKLYVAARDWDDSGSINVCALNTIEKWAVFNKRPDDNQLNQKDQEGLMELYATCLHTFLSIAGPAIEAFLPSEVQQILAEVQEKVLSSSLPRSIRVKLLQLLILREHQWNENAGEKKSKKSKVPSQPTPPPAPQPELCHRGVNTKPVDTRDRAVQVDIEQHSAVKAAPLSLVQPEAFSHSSMTPGAGYKVTEQPPFNLHGQDFKVTEPMSLGHEREVAEPPSHYRQQHSNPYGQQHPNPYGQQPQIAQPSNQWFNHNVTEPSDLHGQHSKVVETTSPYGQRFNVNDPYGQHSKVDEPYGHQFAIPQPPVLYGQQFRVTEANERPKVIQEAPPDPFRQVKAMLKELSLDDLLEVFQENAMRDSVLDLDFTDLKEVLKDCGLRPGQLLEVKTYLKKVKEMKESAPEAPAKPAPPIQAPPIQAPPPPPAESKPLHFPTAETSPPVTLISPQDFQPWRSEPLPKPASTAADHIQPAYMMRQLPAPNGTASQAEAIKLAQQQPRPGMAANLQQKPWHQISPPPPPQQPAAATSYASAVRTSSSPEERSPPSAPPTFGFMTELHYPEAKPRQTAQRKSSSEDETSGTHPREKYTSVSYKSTVQEWLSGKPTPPVEVTRSARPREEQKFPMQMTEATIAAEEESEFPPLSAAVISQKPSSKSPKPTEHIVVEPHRPPPPSPPSSSSEEEEEEDPPTSSAPTISSEENEAAIASYFGKSERSCHMCGAKKHETYDCPERKKKFFF